MSLITEALKKARQEAARQEALKQGSAYPWMATPTAPARGQTRSALAVGILAGCLAAGLGTAGAVWWLSGKVEPQPAVEMVSATATEKAPETASGPAAPAPVIREEPPIVREEPPPPLPVEQPRPASPEHRTEPAAAAARPAPTPEEPPVPEPAAPAAPSPVPQPAPANEEGAAATAAAGLEDGKTYVREVPVPGGGSLRLNGIAFSEDNPVALFSDRLVSPGDSIGGFKVVGMDVKQVALEGHGVKVFVALK